MAQHPLNPNSPFFHEERHARLSGFAEKLMTICGVGTLGGNLAETLARMGFAQLRIIDQDRVEMRNLSVQPYSRAEVGAPKARALANTLYRAVQARVEAQIITLTGENASALLQGSALVIDAFDTSAARAAVSATTRLLSLPCLHIGFSADGLYGNGQWEPHYQIPRELPGDPCDYPLTRPMALSLVALAARAITDFFRENQRHNFELTWNDLKISYEAVTN